VIDSRNGINFYWNIFLLWKKKKNYETTRHEIGAFFYNFGANSFLNLQNKIKIMKETNNGFQTPFNLKKKKKVCFERQILL